MKHFYRSFLFLISLVVFSTNAYSQKYAASQLITNSDGVTYNIQYLEDLSPHKAPNAITAENIEIIWQKHEEYAIGEHSYYSSITEKSFINWATNDKRVAQYGETNTAIWEFSTDDSFVKSFSNKDGSLYIVIDDVNISVLDPATGNIIWEKINAARISFAAAYPDGTGFYFADVDGNVYSCLTSSPDPVWTFQVEEGGIVAISVAEDHSQVIVALSQPGTKILIVDPETGNVTQDIYYYNNSPTQSPSISANGEYLTFADFSGKASLYKRVNGVYELQWQTTIQHAGSSSTWGQGQVISADGSTIAIGTLGFISSGYMGSLYLFNNYSDEPLWSYHEFGDEVCYISMSDDGSLIAAATYGPMDNSSPDLYIFRRESSEPIATLATPGSFNYVTIAGDGSKGVAAGKAVHPRDMGWGGQAYFFHAAPTTSGTIAGNVDLVGNDDNSLVSLTLEDIDNYYATSNEAGEFEIKYIPSGTYSLTATKQGYYSKTIENIEITAGGITNITIELEPAGEPIQNLFATQGADISVDLMWSEFEGSNIGYNIYRKQNPDAPFTEVYATVGANEVEYTDMTALPTKEYYYAVTAVISDDLESPFSNVALGYTSTSFITREIDIFTATTTPTIDGVMSPGEWDDAFAFDASDFLGSDGTFQPIGSVIMYMKADNNNLYVAVENKNDNQLSSGDRTAFYIDDNNNGVYEEVDNESEGNYWINYGPAGNYSIQYRPIYNTGGVGSTYDLPATVAASDATGYVIAEFTLPIGPDDYDITPGPGNKSKAYIYVRDGAYGNSDGQWPFDNPETFVPIGYGTMNFFVDDEVPPPPENISYTPHYFNTPEFVAITWDLPEISDLDYFNVTIINNTKEILEVIKTYGNQIIYNVEDQATYSVTVTTVDRGGLESVPSEALEIITDFIGIENIDIVPVKIYPNPANDFLIIEIENNENNIVEIYNLSGNRVRDYKLSENINSIDISTLSSGVYFIKVDNSIQKFVKY